MGSQELNLELQQRLSDLTVKAREYFQNGNYLEFEKIQYEKWNLIPDPKENWEESYRVSKVFIALYLNYNIDFDKANKWLEISKLIILKWMKYIIILCLHLIFWYIMENQIHFQILCIMIQRKDIQRFISFSK